MMILSSAAAQRGQPRENVDFNVNDLDQGPTSRGGPGMGGGGGNPSAYPSSMYPANMDNPAFRKPTPASPMDSSAGQIPLTPGSPSYPASPLADAYRQAAQGLSSPPPPSPSRPAAPDPLSEVPNAVWYVRPSGGGQYGPAGNEVMRAWVTEGRVGDDSMVWREGWRDWQPAASVFPQLKPDSAMQFMRDLSGGGPSDATPGVPRKSPLVGIIIIVSLVLVVVVLCVVLAMTLFGSSDPHGSIRPDASVEGPADDSAEPKADAPKAAGEAGHA
jgi:hypothetical protein